MKKSVLQTSLIAGAIGIVLGATSMQVASPLLDAAMSKYAKTSARQLNRVGDINRNTLKLHGAGSATGVRPKGK